MDDMGGMGGMGDGGDMPLSPVGVDFSNETQAMDFLGDLLDDTVLQVTSNYYARVFWYGVAVTIAVLTVANLFARAVQYSRLRAAAAQRSHVSAPKHPLMLLIATATALVRESTYLRITPLQTAKWFKLPSFGDMGLLLMYLGFILGLEFANDSVPGAQYYQALGIRAAWLAVAQVPLVILLAGKNNIIGLFTGSSFERLNVLHRWVSRGLLLLSTLHFGYQSYGWNLYGIMQLEWATDTCPPTGIAAYALLLWMNLSTLAPLRSWNYEFFVIQHLITFFGFIIAVMMHLPSTALYSRVYIYIAIALYLVDRLIRTGRSLYHNIRPSHAALVMPSGVEGLTKVVVSKNSRLTSWRPGSFVLLSIPKFGVLQSHPLTVASTPDSHNGDLVFLMRAQKGFTKRAARYARDFNDIASEPQRYLAIVDGPYGGSQADFAAFDTAILVAGGSGITFCVSVLLDLAQRAREQRLPLRKLHLIWIVKSSKYASCFASEMQSAISTLVGAGIDARIDVHVTCAEALTDEKAVDASDSEGCRCVEVQGACCCSGPDDASFAYTAGDATATPPSNTDTIIPAGLSTKDDATLEKKVTVRASSASLDSINFSQGRPSDISGLLLPDIEAAQGETGIAVCGPLGLSNAVRSAVVRISDDRAVHKGTGAQGLYLHVEEFGW